MSKLPEFPSFQEYLTALPTEFVFKRFLNHTVHSRKILSSSSITEITARISTKESLHERFLNLSLENQYTCSLIYLLGNYGLPLKKVLGFDDELLASFLVFAGIDTANETRYFGFSEFETNLLPLMPKSIANNLKPSPAKEASKTHPWNCLLDVTMLCILTSQNMLKKTKKGDFAKISETAMQKFLHALHDNHGKDPVIAESNDTLRNLLFTYAEECKLITFDEDSYKALSENIASWMLLPLSDRYADFISFAFKETALLSKPVFNSLFADDTDSWLCITQPHEAEKNVLLKGLFAYRYLGLADCIKTGQALSFTKTKTVPLENLAASLPQARIMLLADFTALLTQEVLPDDLYWFSKAGIITSFDSVYKGIIQREIVNDSLSNGVDENKMLDWLKTWNAPHNVLATVTEWVREFSRLYISHGASIFSFDEKATRQILSYEPLRRCVDPVESHFVFRIKQGKEAEVHSVLATMGFDPRVPGESMFRKKPEPLDFVQKPVEKIQPIVNFDIKADIAPRTVLAGKYGGDLKKLDLSDLYHVLDYAVLMANPISFEYGGSPLLKKGMYKVIPLHVKKGTDPYLEGDILPKMAKRKFLINCIVKIGMASA